MQSPSPTPRSAGLESAFQQDPQSSSNIIHVWYRDLQTWVLSCSYFSFISCWKTWPGALIHDSRSWMLQSQVLILQLIRLSSHPPLPATAPVATTISHAGCRDGTWEVTAPERTHPLSHLLPELIAPLLLFLAQGSQCSARNGQAGDRRREVGTGASPVRSDGYGSHVAMLVFQLKPEV